MQPAMAEKIILPDDSDNIYFWDFNHELWIDSTCQYEVGNLEEVEFLNYEGDDRSQMHRGECRWYRIVIEKGADKNWLLELSDAHITEVVLYKKEQAGFYKYPESGSGYAATHKSIPHKNHVFELNLEKNQESVFYLKLRSKYPSSGRFHLRTVSYYFGYALEEYYLLGAYYGMLLIMLIYSFLMYLGTKDGLYFKYIWYLVGCGLFTLGEDAIGADMIWSNSVWPNDFIFVFGPVVWMTGFLVYANSFLKLSENRRVVWILTSCLVVSIVSVLFHLKWHYIILLIGVFWTVLVAYTKWRRGIKYARFFVIGYGLVFVGLLYFVLRVFGLLDNTVFNYYVTYYGFIIQALVFAYAMSDRIKQIKLDKESAQSELIDQLLVNEELKDKVNRELEDKVNLRTQELIGKSEELLRANSKLEELSKELYSMNTAMDKENWQLQRVIKVAKEQKVLKNMLSFNEFKEVFPDNISCLKYLADMKWQDGYQCKKCGHLKFMKGEKHHSRKCTKCKYEESAMTGTLFQGVRFDLVKAFYICYHTVEAKKRISSDDLSQILDLRKNTCWAFRKKVLARMENNEVDGWQELIISTRVK